MLKKRKQNKNEIIENPGSIKRIPVLMITIVMTLLAVAFLFPIFLVLMNSFKNKLYTVMHRSHCQIRILFPECTIM